MWLGVDSSRAGEGSASRPLLMFDTHGVASGSGVIPVVVDVGVCAFLFACFPVTIYELHNDIYGFGHVIDGCNKSV